MNRIDWLIAGVIAISVATAAAQGFIYEAFSLGGAVLAYLVAAWGYPQAATWFAPYVTLPWVADIAGFLTIFIGIVLLAGIAGRIARWSASGASLRWMDRLLGGVFGLLRGILVSAVLLMALTTFAPDASGVGHSRLGPYVLMVSRTVVYAAPGQLRERFQSGLKVFRARVEDNAAAVKR
jgi:membrane protein required for colicin V production